MAKLKCISSGSHGNAYVIECKKETLLLELGVSWNEILCGINYHLDSVVGCLVTHKHVDHAKSTLNALKSGLSVYSCQDVANACKGVKVLPVGVKTQIGGFYVQPLIVPHNAMCYAYIITHKEFGKIVFATDCLDFKYKIKSVNHWLIECNHCEELMIDNMCNNIYSLSASENHLEISKTIKTLKANYSCELQNIVLLHLSQGNADKNSFIGRVQEGVWFNNVFVAENGFELELNESEF
jgi:phosphoribosyl 1,2-cyclic phosphodiesterase